MRTSGKTNNTPGWPNLHSTGPGREKHIKRGAKASALARARSRSLSLSLSLSLSPTTASPPPFPRARWGTPLRIFGSMCPQPQRRIFLLSSKLNRAVTLSYSTDLSKSYNTVLSRPESYNTIYPRLKSCDTLRGL